MALKKWSLELSLYIYNIHHQHIGPLIIDRAQPLTHVHEHHTANSIRKLKEERTRAQTANV